MRIKHTGERMIPEFQKGELGYFEHLSRYLFAAQFVKGKSVLDVACGVGYGTFLLAKEGAKEVVGMDISSEAIDYAQKKYRKENVAFFRADAEKMPFKKEQFDVVVSFETIEHLKNQLAFMQEIKRVLKREGLLIISTPNTLVYPKGSIFHLKEFTLLGFRKLLLKYFGQVNLYFQDNAFANYILNHKSLNKTNSWDSLFYNYIPIECRNMLLSRLEPNKNLYLLAVTSNVELPLVKESQILFNPQEPQKLQGLLAEINELKLKLGDKTSELKKIYNSRGWKIISFFHNLRTKIPILKNF